MLASANAIVLHAQTLTNTAPPTTELPDSPDLPVAQPVPDDGKVEKLELVYDRLTRKGAVLTLDGHVEITYRGSHVEADHIEYDRGTDEIVATGHLRMTGDAQDEYIQASHGTINLREQTGHFYDVTGSVGVARLGRENKSVGSNPFLFSGREVIKYGPERYEVIGGTITSCHLPKPDWLFSAGRFSVEDGRAAARNSVFHLFGVPLVYLPYVTHPTDPGSRQSGLTIPIIGQSSLKGLILGDQFYVAFGRSADLTLGLSYFSKRGWLDTITFRYRGRGDDMVQSHYSQLFDRGITPPGGVYTNQGGEDLTFAGRHDFDPETRVAANIEYLSSYIYREAFTENFNLAVSTDILSYAYGVHESNGIAVAIEADRYQGLKQEQDVGAPNPLLSDGQQVRLFHVPSLQVEAAEHTLGVTGLRWSLQTSADGLKRVQPNFVTAGVTERLDVHPEVSYPLHAQGWSLRPAVGVEETFYSRSRVPEGDPGATPVERTSTLNRADIEFSAEARAPVLERTFRTGVLDRLLGGAVKHTVEPFAVYRYVKGVDDFASTLRFDDRDVVSDTNEAEYGVTQRLFVRRGAEKTGCGDRIGALNAEASPEPEDTGERHADGTAAPCITRERITWRLAQKHFFDQRFGGALVTGRRNLFTTTLDFSGVAFLTEPRSQSPLLSRLRLRGSEALDVEWDFDLDIGAKKFTANNVFVDLHRGNAFGGISYARLNAPGRSFVEGVSSRTADFNQMRVLLGYGSPTKRGLSVGANAGLDLDRTEVQYGALETSYNWDCCGLAVEYRKYELGAVRNENAYRFNFTLANIGTAGTLRRAERLF